MARKKTKTESQQQPQAENVNVTKAFHLDFLTPSQKLAWSMFQSHDILFLLGAPGSGKSFLATAFGVSEILQKKKKKLVLTRPIVEAGENLGFLPGDFNEKVNPYMMPLYDCIDKLCGTEGRQKEIIKASTEIAPIAFMRGRSQPLDAKVMTPNGYRSMGELEVGDSVIGSNGEPTKVERIYPQGELDVYKVSFSDGTSVECSADHLWDTTTFYERRYKKGFSTKTTAEIARKLKIGRQFIHQIPTCQPVQFEEQDLYLDPYVLGALLGDGSLHERASITLTSIDNEIIEEVQKRLPVGYKLSPRKDNNRATSYALVSTLQFSGNNEIKEEVRELELLGLLSHEKSIPWKYKHGSVGQRLDLLRGLMDTDGCCFEQEGKRKPRVQFYSTSQQLAEDVVFLVQSLGGTATMRKRDYDEDDTHEFKGHIIKHNHSMWVVGIRMLENPFLLSRKADKFVPLKPIRSIRSIEKVGRKLCQCIRVSAADSLYLTDHFIVTHNTFDDSVFILDEAQNCTRQQIKLAITRLGKNSKMIITGDPDQSDLPGDVALDDIVPKVKGIHGIGVLYFKEQSIVRHPLIAKILAKI